ncbi:hypothetical protein EUZ85_02395 [Hahella sp. KA22]|uniref:pPIWI_RE_Z domain-containing protein n=1 Tax=Hahella sp. KA22 TaxID=1628392 RepID=UPI000FDED199|nr:hypothetical protein [Hahella sp. KA22]AZZ95341.1 hypothetical protein ENC22_30685 [Hahella sp. KA22]QAY52986.1 hypothetical protein EUZ85_02395 [Hahella sp. KA22]
MRNGKDFYDQYRDLSLLRTDNISRYALRDIAITDLCLHFLAQYVPTESPQTIPFMLQGHLEHFIGSSARAPLFNLRQLAGNFCSRLAWRKALGLFESAKNSAAYKLANGQVIANESAPQALVQLLQMTLTSAAAYRLRNVAFAKPGPAKFEPRTRKNALFLTVPQKSLPSESPITLQKRAINPPIKIHLDSLREIAGQVDARERQSSFPQWLPKLNLRDRFERIDFEGLDDNFYSNNSITLDGTQHVVGMLSSGKSTFLQALLFLLLSPGYDKRVVVLTADTAAASNLVARMQAHGFTKSTVVSSFYNRDEHLSMAHWNAQGYPSNQALSATAALTQSLGIACPLEGFQSIVGASDEETLPLKMTDKPCHQLLQSSSSTEKTCPLIGGCPSHIQQRQLSRAEVIAMTPQALVHMTPDKTSLQEDMSFPELFQYIADVVLIDEADSVQKIFDSECTQEKDLLSTNESAFTLANVRAVTKSISDNTGFQYSSPVNVRWHRELNRLQDSISAIYHLLLQRREELQWLTEKQTFTSASILVDLFRSRSSNADDPKQTEVALEQIAILSGMLYSSLMPEDDNESQTEGSSVLASEFSKAFEFLHSAQRTIIDDITLFEPEIVIRRLENAIATGDLSLFSVPPSLDSEPNHKKLRFELLAPVHSRDRAFAVALALLTNVCLSSFAFLVRNHAAVEDDFELVGHDAFREARRILRHYGTLIPRPLYGTVFGLMFEPASQSRQGGTLKLINHLGVGRYLLTHFDKLLKHEGQAGPHTLLLSGTSWAGGISENASPTYDVQWPVSAILKQPHTEVIALQHSRYEFISLGSEPIPVSGQRPDQRRANLRKIAQLLGQSTHTGNRISHKWHQLEELWQDEADRTPQRHRALLVTNNYEDAKLVANELARVCSPAHPIYCLVSDRLARMGGIERDASYSGNGFHPKVILLPRSRVEDFGSSLAGSVLVAPLGPISRGHNIVTPDGFAAISTIYFLHRPHPRPDDYSSVTGMLNRLSMNVIHGDTAPQKEFESLESASKWFRRQARQSLDDGFALRSAYRLMSNKAREQYSWELLTSLWQTIGRGIRGGVPVYVGFVDERFAPGVYKSPSEVDTEYSSCLKQCETTLMKALTEGTEQGIADTLYRPFFDALQGLFSRVRTQNL